MPRLSESIFQWVHSRNIIIPDLYHAEVNCTVNDDFGLIIGAAEAFLQTTANKKLY